MKRYYLRLEVKSPVSISGHENIDGQTTPALDYIPGATLRGALAWHWRRTKAEACNDPNFARLLDEGLLRCGPLYPDNDDSRSTPGLAQVLPATARTCKHQPGFRSDEVIAEERERGHGVRDSLAALVEEAVLARWENAGTPADGEINGLRLFETCKYPDCESAMDRYLVYYETGEFAGRPSYWRSKAPKRLITRSAILPTLQSTAPGNLYSREALEEGQHLAGWLFVDEEIEGWMQEKLGEGEGEGIVSTGEEFYVGAARTAGFGQVRVMNCEADWGRWAQMMGAMDKRLDGFEQRLPASLRKEWSFAPVTLLTDTILLDAHLRHASALTPAVLENYRLLESRMGRSAPPPWPQGMELFVAAARTRRVAGWNTADGGKRPRSDDWAVAAGSVFVLAAPPDKQEELRRACGWLEENGIGERREDGYGQVLVAHPFHALAEEV